MLAAEPTLEPGRFALWQAMRPRQWVKNGLVAAVPLAAGRLAELDVLVATGIAFVCFALVSSAGYLINDVADIEADRAHPLKRYRPLAAGTLSARTAVASSLALAAAAIVVAVWFSTPLLAALVAGYLVLTVSYSLKLKHLAVLDLAVITGAFLIRAIAGGAAAELPVSQWFLIVSAFGALFIIAGKRYSEFVDLGPDATATRRNLAQYSESYLRFVWSVAAGVTILAYCLWAFEVGADSGSLPWAQLSVAPFVVGLLRYGMDIDSGAAGSPEHIAYTDRVLQVLMLMWLILFALGAFDV